MVGWASGNCQDHRAQIFRALERASNRGWRQGRVDDIGRDGAVHALGACEHNVRWSSTGAFILVILVIFGYSCTRNQSTNVTGFIFR